MEEATRGADETREEMVRSWARHRFHVRMFARCSRGAYTRRMDPFSQYLSPFLPLAFLVAAVVAFVREMSATTDPQTKTKRLRIDGKARVLPLVAVISLFVVVWSQYHASPTSPLNWLRIAGETPAVFFLAAGGSSFIQRLKDRGQFTFLEDTTALDESLGQLKEQMRSTPDIHAQMHVVGSIRPKDASEAANAPTVSPPNQDGSVVVVVPMTEDLKPEHPGSLLTGVLDETSDAKAKSKSVPGADTPDEIVKP